MASITSAGVGSGLDLESIIKASVDAENIPKLQSFAQKQEALQVELSALGEVKSAISQLNDTVEKLADIENFNKRTSSIRQPESGDIVSVTTSSSSTSGNYNIEVISLAQGSRALTNTGLFTSSTSEVSATGGNLTLAAGGKSFSVNLAAGATLEDVRTAINSASDNIGVTANIINTGTESRLVYTSNTTGAGNDLVITNDNEELNTISTVATGATIPAGVTIAVEDQAKDAEIKVDGISITSDTNTFKDAIQDITIKALQESENNETARVTVDVDSGSVNELIDKFISDYNNLVGMIGFKTRVGQGLNGDASMRSLESQLVSTLGLNLSNAGPFGTIFDVGLGIDKDGYLEKSNLVRSLNDALSENYDDVGQAFAGENGLATQLKSLLDNYADSSGLIKTREDGLNSELKDLEDDVANHEYRMGQLEERLRKQYSSLDVLLAEMQSTQSYLSAQLAALPGFSSSKK